MSMIMEIMPWVLSAMSAIMLWSMGDKKKWGPGFGLLNQAVWIVYVLMTDQWGLMPGVLVYTFIHARNLYVWNRGG